jgi:hypothetical protein
LNAFYRSDFYQGLKKLRLKNKYTTTLSIEIKGSELL